MPFFFGCTVTERDRVSTRTAAAPGTCQNTQRVGAEEIDDKIFRKGIDRKKQVKDVDATKKSSNIRTTLLPPLRHHVRTPPDSSCGKLAPLLLPETRRVLMERRRYSMKTLTKGRSLFLSDESGLKKQEDPSAVRREENDNLTKTKPRDNGDTSITHTPQALQGKPIHITAGKKNPQSRINKDVSFVQNIKRASAHRRLAFEKENAKEAVVAPSKLLIPPVPTVPKLKVVLDLDETLIHSRFIKDDGEDAEKKCYRQLERRKRSAKATNEFRLRIGDETVLVNRRPGLDAFLSEASKLFDLYIFTAALPDYASPVIDYIDPDGTIFRGRFYRQKCFQMPNGTYAKNLKHICDNMKRTVLVDNNCNSFALQTSNGIPISSFYDNSNDVALTKLMKFLKYLMKVRDVRPRLKALFNISTVRLSPSSRNKKLSKRKGASTKMKRALGLTTA